MAGIDLVKDKHHTMITMLSDSIGESIDEEEFTNLKYRFQAVLTPLEIENATNIMQISEAMEEKGYIEPGKYDCLKRVLNDFNVKLVKEIIEPAEEEIKKMKSTQESQLRSDTGNELESTTTLQEFPQYEPQETSDLEKPKFDIKQGQKGFMLIIDLRKNQVLENDVKTVKNLFENTLKFKVEVQEHLTLNDLKITLKRAQEEISGELGKQYYCFLLVIMGHGNQHGIWTDDKLQITMNEIIDIYKNKEMLGFLGKPKMVFVQTCWGPNEWTLLESDFKICELPVQQDADMLVAYSATQDSSKSYPRKLMRVFIHNLLHVVKEYYKELHLEEMLVIVRQRFLKEQIKEITSTWSTLTKLFYLKNM